MDLLRGGQGHRGVDFAAQNGTPIVAAGSGKVLFAGWTQQYGYAMVIGHTSGYCSFYGHTQSLFFSAGDEIQQGEPIGLVGTTGVSTAAHLHFEIWKDGKPIDPLTVIKSNAAALTAK